MKIKDTLKVIAALMLAAGMVVSGCKKKSDDDDDGTTPNPNDTCGTPLMTFMADGHVLTYDFTYLGTTVTMTHTIATNGTDGQFKTTLTSSLVNGTVYSKECGGWLYRASTDALVSTNKYRKSSTVVGDTWTFAEGSTSAVYNVLAKNQSVTTPAGTFVCDKISYAQSGTINVDTIWFNNAVGDVKYSGTLIDYTLKTINF